MSKSEDKLRCPLCFTILGEGDTLYVYRSELEDEKSPGQRSKAIPCGEDDIVEKIREFSSDDEMNNTVNMDRMLFVSHVKCKAINPLTEFFAEDKIKDDGEDYEESSFESSETDLSINDDDELDSMDLGAFSIEDTNSQNKRKSPPKQATAREEYSGGEITFRDFNCDKTGIQMAPTGNHSIIRMIKSTKEEIRDHENMWFYFPLLYAAGNNNRIELIGSKEVGKTILSLQLSQQESFASIENKSFDIDINDFFYLNDEKSFKREIITRTEWEHHPYSRPTGSVNTPGDIRALFITPPPSSSKSTNYEKGRVIKLLTSLKIGKHIWEILRSFSSAEVDNNNAGNQEIRANSIDEFQKALPRDYYTAIFYDTAGESAHLTPTEVSRVRKYCNKKTILIDAREIFDDGRMSHDSIKLAINKLKEFSGIGGKLKNQKISLVLTKLDLVKDEIDMTEIQEMIESFPNSSEEKKRRNIKARTILKSWLKKDEIGQTLKKYIAKKDTNTDSEYLIDDIFFIWTEGLPKMEGIRISPINGFRNLSKLGSPETIPDGSKQISGQFTDKVRIFSDAVYFRDTDFESEMFNKVEKVAFGGEEAEIISKQSEWVDVIIPKNARTGFVEIEIEDDTDKSMTSKKIFNIIGDTRSCRPKSYGLVQFLAWCIDVDTSEIVNFDEDEDEFI